MKKVLMILIVLLILLSVVAIVYLLFGFSGDRQPDANGTPTAADSEIQKDEVKEAQNGSSEAAIREESILAPTPETIVEEQQPEEEFVEPTEIPVYVYTGEEEETTSPDSPVIGDYVVELQEDETFDIG